MESFEQLAGLSTSISGMATAFIAGFFAVLGAIIGGLLARSTERKQRKRDRICDAYMQFLSVVFVAMHKRDFETVERLGLAVSKIEIFCSKEAADCANDIAVQIFDGIKDQQRFSNLLDTFLLIAKKEAV